MNAWSLCVAVGLLWGVAPLVGRFSSLGPLMLATLILGGGAIVGLPLVFTQTQNYITASPKGISFGALAGLLNGLGVVAFYALVAGAVGGRWELSVVLPAALALMPIVILIGAWVFFGETLTVAKTVGIVLVCTGIWFLN